VKQIAFADDKAKAKSSFRLAGTGYRQVRALYISLCAAARTIGCLLPDELKSNQFCKRFRFEKNSGLLKSI